MQIKRCLATLMVIAASTMAAQAAPVVPSYDSFGLLPGATFGGSGIPNHAVAISTVSHNGNTITLGLTAHQRFVGPNLAQNGAGDFFAAAGVSDPGLGTWNFAFYTDIAGGGTFADYNFEVVYDLDAASDNDVSTHGIIDLNAALLAAGGSLATTTNIQDSQNLGFGYLTTGIPPAVIPPVPPTAYDPNAAGEYTFQVRVYDSMNSLLDTASIRVNVAVPELGSALLVGPIAGVAGLGVLVRRRFNRRKSAAGGDGQ